MAVLSNRSRKKIVVADAPDYSSPSPLNILYVPGRIVVYTVTEEELDNIASGSNSFHDTVVGICAAAMVSIGLVLLTVPIEQPKIFATLVALLITSTVLAAYFGKLAYEGHKKSRAKLTEIKQRAKNVIGSGW